MDSLPSEIISFISNLRPLFRVEVFETFTYLMTGLLIGEAKHGAVRSSCFAPISHHWQRFSDLFTRYKLSHSAFMQTLVTLCLWHLYPMGFSAHLFWILDTTFVEKPYAKKIDEVQFWHRTKQVAGRGNKLKGHCYLFASHLYTYSQENLLASVLVGVMLIGKQKSQTAAVQELLELLPLPKEVKNVWIADRGLMSGKLIKQVLQKKQYALGRLKCNKVVYFAPLRQRRGKGRKKIFGAKSRVDKLVKRFEKRLRLQEMELKVGGKERMCKVWDARILLRGIEKGASCDARIIIVEVKASDMKPLYLLTTELDLEVACAIKSYLGRSQIEVNFDEIKELGLSNYMGRSRQGITRWGLFLCLAQSCLKLISTKHLKVVLPLLNWSWYKRENTVGQIRRRLVEYVRPRISRTLSVQDNLQEIKKAA